MSTQTPPRARNFSTFNRNASPITSKNSPLKKLHQLSPNIPRKSGPATEQTSAVATQRKENKELEAQLRSLSKSHEKLTARNTENTEKLKGMRSKIVNLEKELSGAKSVIVNLTNEKTEIEKKMLQNKEYIRKLETTITMGPKGQAFSDVHEKLSSEIENQKSEIFKLKQELAQQSEEMKEKDREIGNLKNALSIKIEDLKLKGDIKTGLLYELGETKNRLQRQSEEYIKLNEELANTKKLVFFLKFKKLLVGRGKNPQ